MQLKAQSSKLKTLLIVVSMVVVLPSLGRAQDSQPNRAGLVIQHGDGRVVTACVQFDQPSINGIELLDRAGVSYLAQSSGANAAVCQLDGEGCDYPAEDCFCRCKGAECVYWAYQRLREGEWRYSSLGANSTTVYPGDVDGWAWGSGSVQGGAQPPALSFGEICAAAAPAPPTEAAPPPPPPTEAPPPPPPTEAIVPTAAPALPTPPPRPTRTALPQPTVPPTQEARVATAAPTGVAATTQPRPTEEPLPTRGHAPATFQPTRASLVPTSTAAATFGPAGAAPEERGQAEPAAGYLVFGALALLLVGGIVIALLRRRGAPR